MKEHQDGFQKIRHRGPTWRFSEIVWPQWLPTDESTPAARYIVLMHQTA